jgi:hypothetical protein
VIDAFLKATVIIFLGYKRRNRHFGDAGLSQKPYVMQLK